MFLSLSFSINSEREDEELSEEEEMQLDNEEETPGEFFSGCRTEITFFSPFSSRTDRICVLYFFKFFQFLVLICFGKKQ